MPEVPAPSLDLATILDRSEEESGHLRDLPLLALKDFVDASLAIGEPMPTLDTTVESAEIENWIHDEVRRLGRERVGQSGTGVA